MASYLTTYLIYTLLHILPLSDWFTHYCILPHRFTTYWLALFQLEMILLYNYLILLYILLPDFAHCSYRFWMNLVTNPTVSLIFWEQILQSNETRATFQCSVLISMETNRCGKARREGTSVASSLASCRQNAGRADNMLAEQRNVKFRHASVQKLGLLKFGDFWHALNRRMLKLLTTHQHSPTHAVHHTLPQNKITELSFFTDLDHYHHGQSSWSFRLLFSSWPSWLHMPPKSEGLRVLVWFSALLSSSS